MMDFVIELVCLTWYRLCCMISLHVFCVYRLELSCHRCHGNTRDAMMVKYSSFASTFQNLDLAQLEAEEP